MIWGFDLRRRKYRNWTIRKAQNIISKHNKKFDINKIRIKFDCHSNMFFVILSMSRKIILFVLRRKYDLQEKPKMFKTWKFEIIFQNIFNKLLNNVNIYFISKLSENRTYFFPIMFNSTRCRSRAQYINLYF